MKHHRAIVFLIFLYFIICLLAVFELGFLERSSYYSDSEYYYHAYNSGTPCEAFNGWGFVCYSRIFAHYLPYTSFIILQTTWYVFLLLLYSSQTKSMKLEFKLFIFFCLTHPFVAFVFVRGLKELLLIIFVTHLLVLHQMGFQKLKRMKLGLLLYVFSVTRPLGAVLSGLVVLISKITPKPLTALAIAGSISFMPPRYIPFIGPYLEEHALLFDESGFNSGTAFAPLKFLLGPTPIKPFFAFFEPTIYAYATPLTLVILFIGSIYSIIIVMMLLHILISCRFTPKFIDNIILLMACATLIIYSMIYGGSVDTRHRALFFVFIACFIGLTPKWKKT